MVKKVLSMFILVLSIAFVLQLADESKVEAEYGLILVYEDDTSAIYVDDDTLKCNDDGTDIRISVGEKNKRSYDDTIWMNSYKFIYKNDTWTLYSLSSISGRDIRNSRANSPMFTEHWSEQGPVSGVFKTILNYCLKRCDTLIRQANERKRQEEENKRRAEQEKTNRFNALIAEGDKYYAAKDYENARKSYQQARQINSNKIDEYCNELIKNGDNLFNQKLFDSATDYYRKAEVMGNRDAHNRLTLLNHDPYGYVDKVESLGHRKIRFVGWGIDIDDLSSAVKILVYVGKNPGDSKEGFYELTANAHRPDVNKVFKIVGDYHGFDEVIEVDKTKKGLQPIHIWLLNIGTGDNIYLGSKEVNIK